jgi:hypothetical protein
MNNQHTVVMPLQTQRQQVSRQFNQYNEGYTLYFGQQVHRSNGCSDDMVLSRCKFECDTWPASPMPPGWVSYTSRRSGR